MDITPIGAVYGRVSDNQGGRSASVPQQLTAGEAACRENGWNLTYRLQADDGVRASRLSKPKSRPDWETLNKLVDESKIDILLLWEASRGTRRLGEWVAFLDLCRDKGVLIHIISHERSYDPRIPRDWKTLITEGVDAAYEVEMTSTRVGRDKSAKAISGQPDGQVPQGYERIYDPKTKALVCQQPDDSAWIVREIFDAVEKLTPLIRIEQDFRERGIKTRTGRDWSRTTIRQVATNPAYMAKRRYRGVLYDGQWEPIITAKQWWTVHKILSDPGRKTTRPGRRKHMLSYWITCGVCKEPLRVTASTKQAPGYLCPDRHVGGRVDWIDDYVRDLILEWVRQPAQYQRLRVSAGADVEAAENALARLEGEMEEYYALAERRELSPQGLVRMEATMLPQIEAAKESLRELTTPPPLRALMEPGQDLLRCWEDEMTVPQRTGVVQWMFAWMSLQPFDRRTGRATFFDWRRLSYEWAH